MHIKFRDQRKHYCDNVIFQVSLHAFTLLAGLAAVSLALLWGTWLPVAAFAVFGIGLEGFCWIDLVHGWPAKSEE